MTQIEKEHFQRNINSVNFAKTYMSAQLKLYLDGQDIAPDMRLKGRPEVEGYFNDKSRSMDFVMKSSQTFIEYEFAGTELRCVKCRNCKD